jgi:hypothetical protein
MTPPITLALQNLPLLGDDLYLRMQAMNLGIVDEYLRQIESELLRAYMAEEKTPFPEAVFVSAQSQLWIFGLYELLRTWRQRSTELLAFAQELASVPPDQREDWLDARRSKLAGRSAQLPESDSMHWGPFQAVADDPDRADAIRTALDSTEMVFRRIESLRVQLAKHEMPRVKGSRAMAPGYGRIDSSTGSITWQVSLTQYEVDMVSRQRISDDCLTLAEDRSAYLLPAEIQEKVKPLPKYSYAMKRIAVILRDGTEFSPVFVVWNKEIVGVADYEEQPFIVEDIVDVRALPDEDPVDLSDLEAMFDEM